MSIRDAVESSAVRRHRQADPAVENVGATAVAAAAARLNIQLKPIEERKISADQVIARLRPKLAKMPGAQLFLQSAQEIRIGGRASNSQFQYTIRRTLRRKLRSGAATCSTASRRFPQLRDSNTDLQNRGLQASLVIRSRHGVAARHDAAAHRQHAVRCARPAAGLDDVQAAEPVSRRHGGRSAFQQNPESLQDIYVDRRNGVEVPLSAVTSYKIGRPRQSINHQGQFPSVTLSFNLAPGVALGDAVAAVDRATKARSACRRPSMAVFGNGAGIQASLANQP